MGYFACIITGWPFECWAGLNGTGGFLLSGADEIGRQETATRLPGTQHALPRLIDMPFSTLTSEAPCGTTSTQINTPSRIKGEARKMNILIVGHAFGPDLGSEPGDTWNYSSALARDHCVFVIAHPQFRASAEAHLESHPQPNLTVLWTDVPEHWNPWSPEKGNRWIRVHYFLWQRAALSTARLLMKTTRIDIVHQTSWIAIGAPPLLWRLPTPFIWGPIGGGQVAPFRFRQYFGSEWPLEMARSIRVQLLPFTYGVRRAARNAVAISATNQETAKHLQIAGAKNVELILHCSLTSDRIRQQAPIRSEAGLTLLWAGRLERRKCLPLTLEALAIRPDPTVRLLVAGDGPMREEWEHLAHRLAINSRVEFLGRLPWPRMAELFERADAFVFSSLRDSFGSVVLEAMGFGLPIVTLDHQGVGCFLSSETAIKVPVTNPQETVNGLSQAIRVLSDNPDLRRMMGEAALRFARQHTWESKAKRMCGIYQRWTSRP